MVFSLFWTLKFDIVTNLRGCKIISGKRWWHRPLYQGPFSEIRTVLYNWDSTCKCRSSLIEEYLILYPNAEHLVQALEVGLSLKLPEVDKRYFYYFVCFYCA